MSVQFLTISHSCPHLICFLFLFLCFYLCVSISVFLSLSFYHSLSISVFLSLSFYLCLSITVPLCLCVLLYVDKFFSDHTYFSAPLSLVYFFTCLSSLYPKCGSHSLTQFISHTHTHEHTHTYTDTHTHTHTHSHLVPLSLNFVMRKISKLLFWLANLRILKVFELSLFVKQLLNTIKKTLSLTNRNKTKYYFSHTFAQVL